MQVRSLHGMIEAVSKVHGENADAIKRAFGMVDVHNQVLQRVTRDLGFAVAETRRMQVDSDFNPVEGDLGPLKLHPDRTLDLHAYYEEYRVVAETAGEKDADLAVALWAQGNDVEASVLRAKVEREQRTLHTDQTADTPDQDYEVQFFGGTDGQGHNQQVTQSSQANG